MSLENRVAVIAGATGGLGRVTETANWTTPEEIASAIVYLCSDAAGVVNGAHIPLYGAP